MSSRITNLLMLTLGAGIGSAITYSVVKRRYEDAIASIKSEYTYKIPDENTPINEVDTNSVQESIDKSAVNKDKPDIFAYNKICEDNGYEQEVETSVTQPSIISKEDFDNGTYNIEYLTLFSNGVLLNDSDDDVFDISMIGGEHVLDSFGEGEDPDVIYVRNDEYEVDYEITRVETDYEIVDYTETESEEDYDD